MSSPKRGRRSNLENLLGAPSLRPPEPQPDLDLADRLSRHRDALDLAKLLARQRRSEIGVARPQTPHDRRDLRRIEPVFEGFPRRREPRSPRLRNDSCEPAASLAERRRPKLRGTCLSQLAPHHSRKTSSRSRPPRSTPKRPRSNRPPSASAKGDISTLLKGDIPTWP